MQIFTLLAFDLLRPKNKVFKKFLGFHLYTYRKRSMSMNLGRYIMPPTRILLVFPLPSGVGFLPSFTITNKTFSTRLASTH